MAWIQSHQELRDHPKTKRFARRLGISTPTAIGHLHCLWWWAMDYAPDGDLSDYDADDISDAAAWDGNADEFLTALVECGPGHSSGFAENDANGKRLHDWDDYGNQHKERLAAAERKRKEREKRKVDSHITSHITSHSDVTGQSQDSHSDVTVEREEREEREERHAPAHEDVTSITDAPEQPSLDEIILEWNRLHKPPKGQLAAYAVERRQSTEVALESGISPEVWLDWVRQEAPRGIHPRSLVRIACNGEPRGREPPDDTPPTVSHQQRMSDLEEQIRLAEGGDRNATAS